MSHHFGHACCNPRRNERILTRSLWSILPVSSKALYRRKALPLNQLIQPLWLSVRRVYVCIFALMFHLTVIGWDRRGKETKRWSLTFNFFIDKIHGTWCDIWQNTFKTRAVFEGTFSTEKSPPSKTGTGSIAFLFSCFSTVFNETLNRPEAFSQRSQMNSSEIQTHENLRNKYRIALNACRPQ